MNYEKIKTQIKHSSAELYISYLQKLETEKKKENNQWVLSNVWFSKLTEDNLISIFNKISAMGLVIDGDSVTLSMKGSQLTADFNYQAYKNLVLLKYPETKFDFQVVYEGDEFSCYKDSGKVLYKHVMADPFIATERIVKGAYGVIKNSTGEYIEIINKADIEKFKNTAKTSNVWDKWYDRMVKKSIIKRICTSNFKDIVKEVESLDNENYEPDMANFDSRLRDEIMKCPTVSHITEIYNRERKSFKDLNKLLEICSERKKQLEVKPDSDEWLQVVREVRNGVLFPDIKKKYYISEINLEKLKDECL